MRTCLFAFALLAANPVFAESHNHDTHLTEAAGLRLLHVWAPATRAGSDVFFYMEIENTTDAEVMLTGGEVMGQKLDLVGFTYTAAGDRWMRLPMLPVAANAEVDLEPNVLALRWTATPDNLSEGAELKIEVEIGGQHLHGQVEVTAANATAHSHAGHNH